MATTAAEPPSSWGESSPALGRTVDIAFHSARAAGALVATLGYTLLALQWRWAAGWLVVAVSAAAGAHALYRRSARQPSVGEALAVDIFWVAATFLLIQPVALAVVPGLTYLVVAPVLALDGWKAARMMMAAMAGVAVALLATTMVGNGFTSMRPVLALTLLAAVTYAPVVGWLIRNATRQLRSQTELTRQVAAQEARLRLITDNATDALVALDDNGRIRFANQTVETMLGWKREELLGEEIGDLLPTLGVGRSRLDRLSDRLQLAVPAYHRDGRQIPLELTIGRTEHEGRVVHVVVMRDVSEREAANRRIDFQGRLLDQVKVAVVAADPEMRLVYANATAVATFGLRPEGMGQRRLADLFTRPGQPGADGLPVGNDGTWWAELELPHADGSVFPALVTVTKVFGIDGEPVGYAAMAVDITERKVTEEKLAALVASKDQFVSSVAHELRTPLTVIVGMAEELRSSFDQFEADEVRQLIDLIADQANDLANIVQDLLVIGRADARGNLAVNPALVDVGNEIGTAVDLFLPPTRTVTLSVDAARPVWADPGRLRQVIRNLLTNAVRYGGSNLRIEVGQDQLVTTIAVADDGPGVPASDEARIFDPYVRGAGAALPASMGLGLAVARKLSQLMGGDLTYRRGGGWSVFELTVPTATSTRMSA
jgi:PAS domain S-box-containing protein